MKVTRREFLGLVTSGSIIVLLDPEEAWPAAFEAAEQWVPSVCPYCASGCSVLFGVKGGRVIGIRGNPEGWNKGRLCIKGATLATLWDPSAAGMKARLRAPLLRTDPTKRGTFDGFHQVSWDEVLDYLVAKIKEQTKGQAGARSAFAVYGSGQVSTELQYLQAKLGILGLNWHSDNNGRLCQATKVMGMVLTFGIDAPPMAYDDPFDADALFLVGINMRDTLPVWYWRKVEEAKKQKGDALKLVVVDPVRISATAILGPGDLYLPILPGTDAALFNSIAHVIAYELEGVGDVDRWAEEVKAGRAEAKFLDWGFAEKHASFFHGDYRVLSRLAREGPAVLREVAVGSGLEGFTVCLRFLADFAPEKVAPIVGVSPGDIRKAARLFVHGKNTTSLYLQGFGQYTNGVSKHAVLTMLHTLTWRIGRVGAGIMPVVGQPNGLGQRLGGSVVGRLPGNRNHPLPAHRAELAKIVSRGDAWVEQRILERLEDAQTKQSRLGFTAVDLYKQLGAGAIKGIWIWCTNPMVSFPNVTLVMDALRKAELVVVQDVFLRTETAAFADVLLPAASLSGESAGTMANAERRVQLMETAVEPPGDALPDEIIFLAFAHRYANVLEREGRGDEARLLRFLLEPVVKGYEPLFDSVQANVRKLRQAAPEIQARIFAELAAVSTGVPGNDFSGLSYARLRKERDAEGLYGFQIPVPTVGHKGTKRLYTERRWATPDGRLRCFLWDYVPPAEQADAAYPFLLTFPRLYEHWHTRTRTGRVPYLHREHPEAWVSLNPRDAAKLGVRAGDWLEVESRRGRVVVKARIDRVRTPREGVLWMPWAFGFLGNVLEDRAEAPPGTTTANLLSQDATDPISKQPELKLAAVRVRKAA